MPLKLTDTILGFRPGFDSGAILSRLDRPDAKDRQFAERLQFWCLVAGIDSAIPFAQWLLETDNARWVRWNRDLNASGMGIVADSTAQPFFVPDVDAAARLFVQCLYSLVRRERHPGINLWASTQTKRGGEEWFTDVWLPKVQSDAMPDVRTVGDLGLRYTESGKSRATWSWEQGTGPMDAYGKKLVSRITQFYPGMPDQSSPPVETPSTPPESIPGEGDTPMAVSTKKFSKQLVGFQANVPNQKLNVGPGQLEEIVHNTDNPDVGANAQMHRDYVANGGGPGRVSYHSTCDSTQIIQILKLDQVAWHAGDGCNDRDSDEGCFWGISTECCVNADGNLDITFENCAYWMAMVEFGDPRIDYGTMPKAYFEGFIDRALGHQQVSDDGKYCPRAFLDKWGAAWLPRMKTRAHFYLDEMRGAAPGQPSTTYAPAHPVSKESQIVNEHVFLAPGGKTFQAQTTPREYGDPGAKATGPDIAKGTKITQDQISHYVVGTGDVPNIWLVLTGVSGVADGSRVPAEAVIAK